ncbi:variant erythrocyte surface antigen-1 family protein [Babesia caballi]|uniref:Variant erythrocyte surface antigen-1 family protein n=1 Tax=Babesia caballi TaxID=5871 RepID=A0AAV4M305_BABCB|nr:variant erythrocyte surface antigen-1 family protein [Babesia caballi]
MASPKKLTDCPSNLKEAIDWILRVTGKDGGGGVNNNGISELAKEVQKLLESVKESDPGLSQEIENVISALGTGSGNGLIGKLADGLQHFIGYDPGGNNGIIKHSNNGIGASNDPRERLGDAVLGFLYELLNSLVKTKNESKINLSGVHPDIVLKPHLGGGRVAVDTAIQKVSSLSGGNQINQVVTHLKTVTNLKNKDNVNTFATEVSNYLKEVLQAVVTDGKLQSQATQADSQVSALKSSLTTLIDKFKSVNSQQPIDLSEKMGVGREIKKVNEDIGKLNDALKNITGGSSDQQPSQALCTAVVAGTNGFINWLRKGYVSSYQGVDVSKLGQSTSVEANTCAKIFLGCLPLYYQAFTYIYWRCDSSGNGEWETQTFDGSKGHHLKYFMFAMNYETSYLNNRRGSEVLSGAIKSFADFEKGMTEAQQTATKREQAVTTAFNRLYPSGQSPSNQKPTYPEFLHKLHENTKTQATSGFTDVQGNSLAAMYYCALCYFKCQQIKSSQHASRSSSTVREMLYYLAALPFSPNYDAFNTYVTEHFKKLSGESTAEYDAALMIPVADSGVSTEATKKSGGNTLSAADIKDYLTETCMYSLSALGILQGAGASMKAEEPWLHELFCNSQFHLSYASGPAILNVLANCAYAVQFQLSFLFSMCANNGMKCGWQECTYGKEIKVLGHSLQSHICPGFKCNGESCNHKKGGNNCNHNDYSDNAGCGKGSNPSPLQAFLTDNLKGFSLSGTPDPTSLNHLDNHPPGRMCHTLMGFTGKTLRWDSKQGNYIYSALYSLCGSPFSPLRQLSEKLGCLTKRTPRTLGDLFGFIWHLNGQLFNQKFHELLRAELQKSDSPREPVSKFLTSKLSLSGSTLLTKSLGTLETSVSFWNTPDSYGLASLLAANLFSLNQHCHEKEVNGTVKHNTSGCTTSPNDLWSLFQPVRAKPIGGSTTDLYDACRKGNCGGYLSPLTHSAGATYAPDHASVYLSWLAYLTDDFHEWFHNFLEEFKNIDCSRTGCRGKAGSEQACTKSHQSGTHGTSSGTCSCDSVVHCGGVLPLLYRHGFQFYSPYTLSGGSSGNDQTKRNCYKFHTALSNVLTPNAPLAKLLETIDEFLYLFRFYFFYNQSACWTIYVCLILYTFFFLLDTLRVRSHLHFPSSNSIAPISLLGTGKAPALKKFTKLTYFIP